MEKCGVQTPKIKNVESKILHFSLSFLVKLRLSKCTQSTVLLYFLAIIISSKVEPPGSETAGTKTEYDIK